MIIGGVINKQNDHRVTESVAGLDSLPALVADTGKPSASAPGDFFSVTAVGAPATNSPIISNFTSEAGADEHLLLTGEGLVSMSTEFKVFRHGLLLSAAVSTMDTQKGAVKLPLALGAWNAYALWPKNSYGYGSPIIINTAKAYWMDNKCAVGMTVNLYGKNLAYGNIEGTNNSYVYIQPTGGGTITQCTVTNVNPYRVQFTLPAVSNGDFKVWCHNGHGGDYGWSKPLTTTVVSASNHVKTRAWGSTITPSLTANNTSVNNATAISAAIATQGGAGGGIVYIPSGVYYIQSQILTYYDNVKILGDVDGSGKPTSIIKVATGYSASASSIWGAQDMKYLNMIENIILHANGRTDIGTGQGSFVNLGAKEMFYMKNCEVVANGMSPVRFGSANNLYFDDVRFVGGNLFSDDSTYYHFDNCQFEMTHDCDQALQFWKGRQWSLTNNTIKDFDNLTTNGSGWGKGRILGNQGIGGLTENAYISGNVGQNLGVRMSGTSLPDTNVGENYMFEGNTSTYRATALSATATTITFSGSISNTTEAIPNYSLIKIVKGKGIGQCRKVIGNATSMLTIEDEWSVIPDNTSVCMVGNFMRRVMIYKNTSNSSGKPYIVSNVDHNASTGVNFYGGCDECIYDGNESISTRFGTSCFVTNDGAGDTTNAIDTNYFIEIKNNHITGSRIGNFLYAVNPSNPSSVLAATGLLALLYRNNTIEGSVDDDVSYYLPTSARSNAAIDLVVHEKTVMSETIGYNTSAVTSLVSNQVLSENS